MHLEVVGASKAHLQGRWVSLTKWTRLLQTSVWLFDSSWVHPMVDKAVCRCREQSKGGGMKGGIRVRYWGAKV